MAWTARSSLLFLLTVILHLANPSVAGVLAPIQNQAYGVPYELFESIDELSRLVNIAYCVGWSGIQPPFQCLNDCDEFKGFELVTTWEKGTLNSCGYIALSHPPFPKRIIVAFRGTHSIANVLADLAVCPHEYVPYIGDPEQDGDGVRRSQRRCANCTVHAGFLESWHNTRSTILPTISDLKERYPDYELVLVGHSLGGALAALAGIDMHLRGWKPQVTTFGEPRIGNEEFVNFLDETFALNGSSQTNDREQDRSRMRFRRVTHVDDPVPLLPLEEWGYKMHAGEIFISKPDLPVSKSDLHFCDGNQDQRCIAGMDETLLLLREDLDQRRHHAFQNDQSRGQIILSGNEESSYGMDEQNDDNDDDDQQKRLYSQWNPIPPEFRLWELLFAHRDYITRIGLCSPSI